MSRTSRKQVAKHAKAANSGPAERKGTTRATRTARAVRVPPTKAAAPGKTAAPAGPGRRWAWRAVAVLSGLFALAFTVPWKPADEAPIGAFDFSWMLLVHDAVATGRQFGTQIILPQGPTAFLGNSVYDPRTYWVLVTVRSLIALVAVRALWEAARRFIPHPLAALPWLVAIIALTGRTPDHFFPALALLLPASYFAVHDRKVTGTVIALAAVLGVVSLIKLNQPFCAAVAVAAVGADPFFRRRTDAGTDAGTDHGGAAEEAHGETAAGTAGAQAGGAQAGAPTSRHTSHQRWRTAWIVPGVYLAAIVLSYLATRQSPSSAGPFLWGWYQVTVGHLDAVGLPGPLVDALAYLLVVAMVTTLVAAYAWRRWRWGGVLLPAGTAGLLLLLYKHSFVRQDIMHAHIGPMVATAAALLYAPLLWPRAGRPLRGLIAATLAVSAAVASSILSSYTGTGLPGYALQVIDRCAGNVSAALSPLADPGRLRRDWQAARETLRAENRLPLAKVHGSVDVYPHRQDVVFAYGLDYQPRPVVSSLVATAPVLADLNARHLRGPAAAQTVLFDVEPVDHNFPTILDGASLPELLTRYDVADASGALLVLSRSASPRPYRFTPAPASAARVGRFGEAIPVPDAVAAPLWVNVHFRPRLAGRLLAALYKPPTLGIAVHTAGGADAFYRLLPTLADRQGFLLSPLIQDRADYARLASRSWSSDLSAARVQAVTITVEDGSQDASFDPDFAVEFRQLEFRRQ